MLHNDPENMCGGDDRNRCESKGEWTASICYLLPGLSIAMHGHHVEVWCPGGQFTLPVPHGAAWGIQSKDIENKTLTWRASKVPRIRQVQPRISAQGLMALRLVVPQSPQWNNDQERSRDKLQPVESGKERDCLQVAEGRMVGVDQV